MRGYYFDDKNSSLYKYLDEDKVLKLSKSRQGIYFMHCNCAAFMRNGSCVHYRTYLREEASDLCKVLHMNNIEAPALEEFPEDDMTLSLPLIASQDCAPLEVPVRLLVRNESKLMQVGLPYLTRQGEIEYALEAVEVGLFLQPFYLKEIRRNLIELITATFHKERAWTCLSSAHSLGDSATDGIEVAKLQPMVLSDKLDRFALNNRLMVDVFSLTMTGRCNTCLKFENVNRNINE